MRGEELEPGQEAAAKSNTFEARNFRCNWVKDNPDLVAVLHALRVELQVRLVMQHVVQCNDVEPFQYWLRFEWGSNGNPHAHGQCYVAGNPSFESVVEDAATADFLRTNGAAESEAFRTKEEAEADLGEFFGRHVCEWHPGKTAQGVMTYNFVLEILRTAEYAQPQCVDLYSVLESVLDTDDGAVTLQPLHRLLAAIIETGQRHTGHGEGPPVWGRDSCARKGCVSKGTCHVYCRYLFPRVLRFFAQLRGAVVDDDPHRPGLKNLYLARNDPLLNGFEAHLLLANLGNIDWRALLNLWAVLEYLTKYTAKAGKGSVSFKKTFLNVTEAIDEFEKDDGLKDLWRTAIMKFYSRVLGDRDYSLLESMHFGLRLPATLSNFGPVQSVSVSNWVTVKPSFALRQLRAGARATWANKRELFDDRAVLQRPASITNRDLENLSLYAFWRLFDVVGGKLVRKQKEWFVALSGTCWALTRAKTTRSTLSTRNALCPLALHA